MYYTLNETNIIPYIKKLPGIMETVFKGINDLQAVDLAEGNINLIFRVFSKNNPYLILENILK